MFVYRVQQLIRALRGLSAKTLDRCTDAIKRVDDACIESERISEGMASVTNGYRVLSNAQFLEKRVETVEDKAASQGGGDSGDEDSATSRVQGEGAKANYIATARQAVDAIRGRWAETRDGGLALTGNKYWRPLPSVIGTTAYYHDESCGLDPYLASNPNPERWGPYISSDDDDSSEVSDDSSDSLESDISSESVSSTSSEGEYSDMEDNLADLDNYNDGGGVGLDDDGYDGDNGRGGGGDLFAAVTKATTTLSKSARKSAPSYALSYDDIFGDDVRGAPSTSGLFDDDIRRPSSSGGDLFSGVSGEQNAAPVMSAPSVAPAKPAAVVNKPKGLFDSDSDSDNGGDLFGMSKKASNGDLFAGPLIADPLSAMKKEAPKLSNPSQTDVDVATTSIAAMSVSEPVDVPSRTTSQGLLFDSDSDSDDGLFSTTATTKAGPSIKRSKDLFD